MGDADRFVRWSARVALRGNYALRDAWKDLVVEESDPAAASAEGMLALWCAQRKSRSRFEAVFREDIVIAEVRDGLDTGVRGRDCCEFSTSPASDWIEGGCRGTAFGTNSTTSLPRTIPSRRTGQLDREYARTMAYANRPAGDRRAFFRRSQPGDGRIGNCRSTTSTALREVKDGWTAGAEAEVC